MKALPPNWSVPPFWAGSTAFLLGCGPSLNVIRKYPTLSHYGRVIAVNDAFELCPHADVLYFHDHAWWQSNRSRVSAVFQGRWIVTTNSHSMGVSRLRCADATGLEKDPAALAHGSNSGYQAINLAYHFGAKVIVLIGYDLQTVKGRVHWQQRSSEQVASSQKTMATVMLPRFATLEEPLRKAGVKVYNATPGSALKVWPYRELVGILSDRSKFTC